MAGSADREPGRTWRRVIGIVALVAGRGPRTASNDLYHRIMLALIGAGLLILVFGRSAFMPSRNSG
jgi:hypothetical protein